MHGDSSDVVTHRLDFPGMKPTPNVEPPASYPVANSTRAADGTCRAIEGGEDAVSSGLHLSTPETLKLAPGQVVEELKGVTPTAYLRAAQQAR